MTPTTGVTRNAILIAGCATASILSAAAQQTGAPSRPGPANLPLTNPFTSASDVEAGRRLYVGRCGHCHGQSGEGGRGAVLTAGQFRHGESDRDLFLIVRSGIPNTEMPGSPNLQETDLWRIVAYVRQLSRQGAAEPITGDAAAGALVYQRHACSRCHNLDGQGGFLGPALTDIGVRRASRYLRQSIVDPNADIPLDYRSVQVITATGTTVVGIHLNEDEYSIHVREMNGALRSFLKSELKATTLTGESLMPAYASLSKEELDNLVAYLSAPRPKP